MIRHLFKLVWNRKRSTALLIAEITLAFLVLFGVATGAADFVSNYSHPLGYKYENVWNIAIDTKSTDEKSSAAEFARMERLIREARSIDGVEAAAVSFIPPMTQGAATGEWRVNGRDVTLYFDEVTDGFADVMQLNVQRGRWFAPADDALAYAPVVIDGDTAKAVYGDADPVGQLFDKEAKPPSRVIGVIEEFRKGGELSGDTNFVFHRVSTSAPGERIGRNLLLRVRPGMAAEFEETLLQRLGPVAGDWSLEIRRLSEMRESMQRLQVAPAVVGGVIAAFLVLMVAFGLSGVLWQSVTQRRAELGLRRAIGATAAQVRRQVLIELAIITTLGVALGVVLVVQIPILGILSVVGIPLATFATGVAAALALMYVFTFICGIYPSWLATTIEPADALRAE